MQLGILDYLVLNSIYCLPFFSSPAFSTNQFTWLLLEIFIGIQICGQNPDMVIILLAEGSEMPNRVAVLSSSPGSIPNPQPQYRSTGTCTHRHAHMHRQDEPVTELWQSIQRMGHWWLEEIRLVIKLPGIGEIISWAPGPEMQGWLHLLWCVCELGLVREDAAMSSTEALLSPVFFLLAGWAGFWVNDVSENVVIIQATLLAASWSLLPLCRASHHLQAASCPSPSPASQPPDPSFYLNDVSLTTGYPVTASHYHHSFFFFPQEIVSIAKFTWWGWMTYRSSHGILRL